MSIVSSRLWRNGQLAAEDFPLEDLDMHLADPSALVWLDIVAAGPDKLLTLSRELGLDPQAVEDATAPHERPKATRHKRHTFVTMQAVDLDGATGDQLIVHPISAFVVPRGLITVRPDTGFDLAAVEQQWRENQHLLGDGPAALLHGLLDVVVDGHFAAIQQLDDAMEAIEDVLFDERERTREVQQHVYRLRKALVQLRRVVLPMREVVNAVGRHRVEADAPASPALQGAYDDLYDHVLRASEWTESLRDMVSTIFETNLSLQDARLNEVMKKLAAWAAIIAVPTAVTGWFGQNIPYPGFATHAGLIQSVVLMLVGTVGLYIVFRKADWI